MKINGIEVEDEGTLIGTLEYGNISHSQLSNQGSFIDLISKGIIRYDMVVVQKPMSADDITVVMVWGFKRHHKNDAADN